MEGQEEPLSDTDTTSSTDLELVALEIYDALNHLPSLLHQLHHLQDCKLILQNKEDYKSPDLQRVQLKTLHYLL